jgi:hypothetical protein
MAMPAAVWSAFSAMVAFLGPPLLLTVLIEVPVGWLCGLRSRRAVSAVVLVNVVTNPVLNYLLLVFSLSNPPLPDNSPVVALAVIWGLIAVLEVLAVVAEWRMLLWVLGGSSRRMLVTSVLMNAASFGLGLAISVFFGRGGPLG